MDLTRIPANWLGSKRVVYGITYSTDTCTSCFFETGKDVPATHEVLDSADHRIPVCTKCAEDVCRSI